MCKGLDFLYILIHIIFNIIRYMRKEKVKLYKLSKVTELASGNDEIQDQVFQISRAMLCIMLCTMASVLTQDS
jgi:hypothetical protein